MLFHLTAWNTGFVARLLGVCAWGNSQVSQPPAPLRISQISPKKTKCHLDLQPLGDVHPWPSATQQKKGDISKKKSGQIECKGQQVLKQQLRLFPGILDHFGPHFHGLLFEWFAQKCDQLLCKIGWVTSEPRTDFDHCLMKVGHGSCDIYIATMKSRNRNIRTPWMNESPNSKQVKQTSNDHANMKRMNGWTNWWTSEGINEQIN